MRFQVLLRRPNYLALTAVSKFLFGFLQGKPARLADFDAHLRSHIVDAARLIQKQVEADSLQDPLPVAPGADVNILDVAELGNEFRADAGLFSHLALRRLGRLLALVDESLGQRQHNFSGRLLSATG